MNMIMVNCIWDIHMVVINYDNTKKYNNVSAV